MNIGQRIKRLRTQCGMTLEDLAKKVGVSRQTLSRYETGVIENIPSDKIEIIATVLGASPAAIMGWDHETETPASASADGWESEAIQLLRSLSKDDLERELAYLRQRAGDSDK